jgi:hypothetical protein
VPDGQIRSDLELWRVQRCHQKYFCFAVGQIKSTTPAVHPTKGRIAIVTDAGLDAVDAEARFDEARQRGRQSRVVLTPRRWRQVLKRQSLSGATVARKPGHRGERGISRKTIAQGRPDASAEPVCSCAFFSCAFGTRDRGCSAHPVFPAPSDFREREFDGKPRAE